MVALPKVLYIDSAYISHARAAQGYRDLLSSLGCLTDQLSEAQVVILHVEAPQIPALLARVPALRSRHLIAYSVWETDRLPQSYIEGLKQVDEVWTASSYCAGPLWKAGYAAHWIPHFVAQPSPITPAAREQVKLWLGPGHHPFDVLYVSKRSDPRKDNKTMVRAMQAVARVRPGARLILKVGGFSRQAGTVIRRQGALLVLDTRADEQQMQALRQHVHLIASSHHSEGWGLTLSEAMAQKKPTLAPASTGNLTFMSHNNSFLVPSVDLFVKQAAGHFTPSMRWGQVLPAALERCLLLAHDRIVHGDVDSITSQAARDMRRFGPRHIKILLRQRLERLSALLGQKRGTN